MSLECRVILFCVFIVWIKGVNLQRNLRMNHQASIPFDYQQYYTYDEINEYLDDLNNFYPYQVTTTVVGKSFEERLLKSISITNGDGRTDKKVIFVEAGSHGNEWIATAAALFIINQLVENQSEYANLLKDLEWIILPVVNPDGYEFTKMSPANRKWCKSRKPIFHNGGICYGSDINMNFDFHWSETGSSTDPCSNQYSGPSPFSESEAVIVRDLIHSYARKGLLYLSLHSFGNLILYPWAWTHEMADACKDLHEVAKAGADAILNNTTNVYTVGSYSKILHEEGGGSMDYAYNTGFQYSYTLKLPAGGSIDYNIDSSYITNVVEETWVGIRAMTEKILLKSLNSKEIL